jgi:hypothetical protein
MWLCGAQLGAYMQEAMEHLETPALLVFLHQVTLLGTMLVLNTRGMLQMVTASAADLHAAAPAAVLDSLQLILFFAALTNGSVLFLIALTATVSAVLPRLLGPTMYAPQAMASLASLTQTQQVSPDSSRCCLALSVLHRTVRLMKGRSCVMLPARSARHWCTWKLTRRRSLQAALGVAAVGAFVELLASRRQSMTTWLYIALWLLVSTTRCLWSLTAETATSGQSPALGALAPDMQQTLSTMAAGWQQQQPVQQTFLAHALSCIPVLCLALLFQEGVPC